MNFHRMFCKNGDAPKGQKEGLWVLFILIFSVAILYESSAWSATLYMGSGEAYTNLQSAMAAMSGGDTLIIRNGTYTGPLNVVDSSHYPPNGTANKYTIIKAENTGMVIFDGENERQMFSLYGSSPESHRSYVKFEGLGYKNSSDNLFQLIQTDHINVIRCFCYDGPGDGRGGDGFSVSGSSYVLFEECWSYGAARKHFYIAKSAEKIIARRCVVRHDRHLNYADQEAFMVYDAKEVELQNCISIDGDQGDYYTGDWYPCAASYTTRNTAEGYTLDDVYIRGCISIGNDDMTGAVGSSDCGADFIDFVHWDSEYGIRMRGAGSSFDHCTIGDVSGTGTWSPLSYLEYGDPITNSLLYSAYQGIWNARGNDYNSLYLVENEYVSASPGTNSICKTNSNAIDPLDGSPGNGIPALKYLTRIEDDSNLDGAASDGGDVGATILKKIGVSGTLWGETGYNTTTNDNLWPFPNEEIIRQHMRAYSYDGGNLSGARGFCADGQTLTKYIWEYLGNPIPPEIYGDEGSNQVPYANAGSDQNLIDSDENGLEQVTLDASASYDPDGNIISYIWSENGSQIATGVNPLVTLGLGTHVVSLVVTDNEDAVSTDDVCITINLAEKDQTPPVLSNVQAVNIVSTSATISWNTDEPSTTKVLYGLTSSYGQQVENVTLVTDHEIILLSLEPSTIYHFQTVSMDGNNNEASSYDYTFTTQSEETTSNALQDFEDGILWIPGDGQDPTGNERGWAFIMSGTGDKIEIDNIGANGSSHSLKLTFASSDNDQIYFRSNDKITDHMPEAAGANRMSFYVRFPADFPIQPLPFRYDTWQVGTYIHDPNDWSDTHQATFEDDHGIHHYYHRLTIEQVGDGWVKYIVTTQPDQANYSGSTVPPNIPHYFDSFGRFYFHFGSEAGGPEPSRPFTIWIDEIKFYYDDGSVGGQIHVGGQDDDGFDGQFFADSDTGLAAPYNLRINK